MTNHNDALFLHKYCFIGFSPDHDREDAWRIFEERMGYPPQMVQLKDNVIWVGPVLSEEIQGPEQLRLC